MDTETAQQNAPAPVPVQTLAPEIVQQMIISVFYALGLSGKPFPTSSPWYFVSAASNHITTVLKLLQMSPNILEISKFRLLMETIYLSQQLVIFLPL